MNWYGSGFIPIIISFGKNSPTPPPPGSQFIITEDDDFILSEDGDNLITE
jgi:hypothetical protein